MLTPTLESQIAALAARYGEPRRVVAAIPSSAVQPLNMGDRLGEVCMVFRRPGGLLTAIKTFYPRGCYRLLTGGVEHGELIEDALWREVAEETGLEVTATRFLAVIEYAPADRASGRQGDTVTEADSHPLTVSPGHLATPSGFATFAFLLDAPHGEPVVHDPRERLESFREIAPAELPALAATLEAAPDEHNYEIDGNWRDWGVFRAVAHRVVHELLA